MIKRIALFLLFCIPAGVFAQKSINEIDKYIEKTRRDWKVPGMAVAIVQGGSVVHSKGYGTRSVDSKDKVDNATLFAIASNTKAFISTSLARLVDQGKMDWNDRVIDHLPYFRLYDSYVTQETRVVDLLCHRVGLGTFSGDVIWYKSDYSAEEVVKKAQYVPNAYQFRNGYGYSNLMFIAAGEVIQAVSGMPWYEYVEKEFFNPLGMSRTITSTDDLKIQGNFASPHKMIGNEEQPIEWVNWDNMGAAGGIISSADDMAKWIQFHLDLWNTGKSQLLSAEAQNKTWTMHNSYEISLASRESIPGRNYNGYGLGWGLTDYFGQKVVTHSGGYDGMYSRVVLLPDLNSGFVILTNSMTGVGSALMYYLINAFISEDNRDWSTFYLERELSSRKRNEGWINSIKATRVAGTTPSKSISEISGEYYDPLYGTISVIESQGKLRLLFTDAPDLSATLQHWHYDTYEIDWDKEHAWFGFGTIMFQMDNDNQVSTIEFQVPNYDIFFHEIHAKKL